MASPYGYGPPPPAAGNDRTQLWGILGMVTGLLCCPIVGIVFGVLSMNEAKKWGKPKTLGIIAIVCSVIGIFGWSIVDVTYMNRS